MLAGTISRLGCQSLHPAFRESGCGARRCQINGSGGQDWRLLGTAHLRNIVIGHIVRQLALLFILRSRLREMVPFLKLRALRRVPFTVPNA